MSDPINQLNDQLNSALERCSVLEAQITAKNEIIKASQTWELYYKDQLSAAQTSLKRFIESPPAEMSSSIGLIPINSYGVRTLVDALAKAQREKDSILERWKAFQVRQGAWCVNCDWDILYTASSKEEAGAALREHRKYCPKDPMRLLEKENAALRAKVEELSLVKEFPPCSYCDEGIETAECTCFDNVSMPDVIRSQRAKIKFLTKQNLELEELHLADESDIKHLTNKYKEAIDIIFATPPDTLDDATRDKRRKFLAGAPIVPDPLDNTRGRGK